MFSQRIPGVVSKCEMKILARNGLEEHIRTSNMSKIQDRVSGQIINGF